MPVDRKDYLLGIGGLAAGCLLGSYLTKDAANLELRTMESIINDLFGEQVIFRPFQPRNGITRLSDIRLHSSEITSSSNKKHNVKGNSEVSTIKSRLTDSTDLSASGADMDTVEYPCYEAASNFPNIERNRTLMARYLTPEVYEYYFGKQTTFGTNLDACIQAGIDNHDKISCGVIAGDEECYDLFSRIFDPVITDRHRGFTRNNTGYGRLYYTRGNKVKAEPLDTTYVKSIHFLTGRCMKGFRFPPTCSRAERLHVENLMKMSLESLQGEFVGTYHHLAQLSLNELQSLPDVLQSVAACPTSSTLKSSGSTRDWPNGRGVFKGSEGKLFAWTNREDHLRVMYRSRDKKMLDFTESFKTFCKAMNQLELILKGNGMEFVYHESYGYLLTCPSGIGTALRAGAHMNLRRLTKDARFKGILKELRLHMGSDDEESFRRGFVDVYNMDRLGFDEGELVQHVAEAINTLVKMEKRLEGGEDILDLIPKHNIENNEI